MSTYDSFKDKIDDLNNDKFLKSVFLEELKKKNDTCNLKTYLNFKNYLIPFFVNDDYDFKEEFIKYIFLEDIFNIGGYRDENLDYFVRTLINCDENKLNCSNCKNKLKCNKEFGSNTGLIKRIILMALMFKRLKFYTDSDNRIKDSGNGIKEGLKSLAESIESVSNKKELLEYLCNDFIEPYLNHNEWSLDIAKFMLEINLINDNDFKIVKNYYNRKHILNNSLENNFSTLINESPTLKELHKMIGLKKVKEQIEELYDLLCFKKLTEHELSLPEMTLNCIFEGNPGTGKTRTAKLYAKLLYETGFIKTDKLVCVSASDLIAEHIGGTAIKTVKVIEESLGGVLFIDEAYQLTPSSEKDYGKECIATLVREMTEHKNDLVIIFAGYKSEMQDFIDVNPGMKSRITNRIVFEDYSIDELYQIFKLNSDESKFNLSDDIEPILKSIFQEKSKDKSFGNARFVENLFQEVLIKHSRNTMKKIRNKEIEVHSEDVKTIDVNDIPHHYILHEKKELKLENINKKEDLSHVV